MHYYKFNISDWQSSTRHLTPEEEGVYFRLINYYYDTEKPIPLETQPVIRRLMLGNQSDIVGLILDEFFVKTERGYEKEKCNEIIKEYKKTANKNKKNGAKGGRPRKQAASSETQEKPTGLSVGTQEEPKHNPNQEPLTNNQEPVTSIKNPMSTKADTVRQVFAYWCEVMGKNPNATKLNNKRKSAIQARLKEGYTLDQLKQSIDGCKADPFSMGQNERNKPFNDIELICRNGTKVEGFWNVPMGLPSPIAVNKAAQRINDNIEKSKGWLDRVK